MNPVAQIRAVVEDMLRPLRNRIVMTISRAVIEAVKDSEGVQFVKTSLLTDEEADDMERFQEFGFTSNPPSGSEAIAVFVGGNREHGVVVATENRSKRKRGLSPGESALYTDPETFIYIKANGQIHIKTAATVKVEAPSTELTGNLMVGGNAIITGTLMSGAITAPSLVASGTVSSDGTSIASIKSTFNAHTHISGAPSTPTAPPLPVIP